MELTEASAWHRLNFGAFLIALVVLLGAMIGGGVRSVEFSGHLPIPASRTTSQEIQVLMNRGDTARAADRIKSFMELREGNSGRYFSYGRTLSKLGRKREAIAAFETSLAKRHRDPGRVHQILASLYLAVSEESGDSMSRQADLDNARSNARRAAQLGRPLGPNLKAKLGL